MAIMGVGNVYRHDYEDVANEFFRRTAHDNLEPLVRWSRARRWKERDSGVTA
jgi:hypothetical protein